MFGTKTFKRPSYIGLEKIITRHVYEGLQLSNYNKCFLNILSCNINIFISILWSHSFQSLNFTYIHFMDFKRHKNHSGCLMWTVFSFFPFVFSRRMDSMLTTPPASRSDSDLMKLIRQLVKSFIPSCAPFVTIK